MADYRQGVIAVVIAVLVVFFVNASIDAFIQEPSRFDLCNLDFPDRDDFDSVEEFEQAQQEYKENQEQCMGELQDARDEYNSIVFLVSIIAAAIAIVIGLYLPIPNSASMTVTSGILLGGLFTLFVGTIRGWDAISEVLRPVVLLLELILVIFLTYRYIK